MKALSEMSLEELWQLFPIILRPYSAEYPNWFRAEADLLQTQIAAIRRIRHIGSTAIPGIMSKPTVDILMEIADHTDLKQLQKNLSACGYTQMAYMEKPYFALDLCKGYTENGFAERVFHLHVRNMGDWPEPKFCANLCANPQLAREYEALKIELAARYKHNRDAYTSAKTAFVVQHSK